MKRQPSAGILKVAKPLTGRAAADADVLTIAVTVKPRARTDSVAQIDARSFTVSVRAMPHDGKANEAVIELLSEHFSVPKSKVKITRGQSSRKKIITIG
jgi:uncharacterized protein